MTVILFDASYLALEQRYDPELLVPFREVGIRVVMSIDGMTADWARIPWDVLEKISVRIVNEVNNVTAKTPGVIPGVFAV
ncbi:hypothetical protein M3194_26445 [Paenibacillus glycanilyticus]|nr:hypothetical protein [Paenibacillus glycanilyticus]MCM3630881.1 hypothetical protein [Paenibacillus glycanilyticus]